MVKEIFCSGYCRALDGSRMVCAEIDGDTVDADCAYPDCPYAPNCDIAKKLSESGVQ